MPIAYTIDHEKKFITERWTGEIRADDLAAYWKRYLADPAVLAIRCTLVDLREANILFNGSELEALISRIVLPVLKDKDWKTAILVERPSQFGVGRQYQVFADRFSKDAIFYELDKAHQWLLGSPD